MENKYTQQVDFSNPNADKVTSGTTKKHIENKKSLTAVEWFYDQITRTYWDYMTTEEQNELFKQAKEIEKEQKSEDWQLGYDACEFHNDYDELQKEPMKNPYRNKI
jgi:hypothetical protein